VSKTHRFFGQQKIEMLKWFSIGTLGRLPAYFCPTLMPSLCVKVLFKEWNVTAAMVSFEIDFMAGFVYGARFSTEICTRGCH
jgi:hypothetical protein